MVRKTIYLISLFLSSLVFAEDIETRLNFANAYLTLGAPEKAIPQYQRMLTQPLTPKQKLILLYNLGTAYVANEEPQKSLSPFQEIVGIPLIEEEVHQNAAEAFYQLALKAEERVLQIHYLQQAKLLLHQDEFTTMLGGFRPLGDSSIEKLATEPHLDLETYQRLYPPIVTEKTENLLTPEEGEEENSLRLRAVALMLLLKEENSSAIGSVIQRQKDAILLTKLLPFQDPYDLIAWPLTIKFQKRVSEMESLFVSELYYFQKEIQASGDACPLHIWESVTEHLQAGLDLSGLAEKALVEKSLPFTQVIPLQQMALSEWEKAQKKLEEIPQIAKERPQAKEVETSVEKLTELFHEDQMEQRKRKRPIPEGAVW